MSYIPFGEVIVTVDFTDGLLSDVYTDVVDAGVTDAFFPSYAIFDPNDQFAMAPIAVAFQVTAGVGFRVVASSIGANGGGSIGATGQYLVRVRYTR